MSILKKDARETLQNCFAWQKTTPTGPHDPKAKKNNLAQQANGAIVGKVLRAAEHQPQHLADCLRVMYDPSYQSVHMVRLAVIVWDRFVSRAALTPRKQARLVFALSTIIESVATVMRGGEWPASDSLLSRMMGYADADNACFHEQYREHVKLIRAIVGEIEEAAMKPVFKVVSEMRKEPEQAAS